MADVPGVDPAAGVGAAGAGADLLAHLRWGLAAGVPLLVGGALVGYLVGGPVTAAGFAAGGGMVIASFAVTSLMVALAVRTAPALVLPVGMTVYATKFLAIVLIMATVGDSGWAGRLPMGIGFIAMAGWWAAAQVAWVLRRGPHARRPGVSSRQRID